MYTSTRKWVSDRVRAKTTADRRHKARKHLCPDSPFFTEHFNFEQHDTMMKKENELYEERLEYTNISVYPFRGKIFASTISPIFDEAYPYSNQWNSHPDHLSSTEGKFLHTVCSPVLCMPTIWQWEWENNKNTIYPDESTTHALVAPFPNIQELKFEGTARIATAQEHRRFFPVPREVRNDTVSWPRRPFLKPHELDKLLENAIPNDEDIFFHNFEVGLPNDDDLQVRLPEKDTNDSNVTSTSDDDPYEGDKATRLLGNELLTALDPQHVYF